MREAVASLGLVSPGAGDNRRAPNYVDLFKLKNSQFLVFYIKKLNSSTTIKMSFFNLLHTKNVIYNTKFSTYLSLNHFTHKIYFLLFYPQN